MTHYYVKKGSDGKARVWLSCEVVNGELTVSAVHPHDGTYYLYKDAPCTDRYGTDPSINADDDFHTSQSSMTIIFDPTVAGGWTFTGRYKSDTGAGSSPFVAKAADHSPASFSVVATSGTNTETFDPVIRFNNTIMAQSGVPGGYTVVLGSAYLDPPRFGAHTISLEFLVLPGHPTRGVVILDSAAHAIDRWGDPASGLASVATRYEDLVIESVEAEDPTGQGRELGRLKTEAFGDSEIYLVKGPGDMRWTLVCGSEEERVVIPMTLIDMG